MLSNPSPIIVFAFNRPGHLQRTLRALGACPEAAVSPLTIHCDGPRRSSDEPIVREVREVALAANGFASVQVISREGNLGLATSIIEGVTHQMQKYGRVIVLEDDIVVSPHFLRYMNDALEMYAHDEQVASIHGYVYPVAQQLPETFFLRGADCWGWATWARAWHHFRADGSALLAELRSQRLTRTFDLDGTYPYTRMLEDQIAGRNNSWAVRWHASCFLRGMLTLYPGQSLVVNIGNDDSGTHSGQTSDYDVALSNRPVDLRRIELVASRSATDIIANFFRRQRGLLRRIANRLRRSLPRPLSRLPGRPT
jgi:hypothetical protein